MEQSVFYNAGTLEMVIKKYKIKHNKFKNLSLKINCIVLYKYLIFVKITIL
jgi:hypothetical protein